MAYDRDRWSNPLRRLKADLFAIPMSDMDPNTRRHLNQTIDDYLVLCKDFFTQQAAARGIAAHWESLRCEEAKRKEKPGSRLYVQLVVAHTKQALLANQCFKLAGLSGIKGSSRMKPPTRGASNTNITSTEMSNVR